jgi:glucose/mannose-6-phosphate isomerase
MPGARRGIRAVVDQLRVRRDECGAPDGGLAAQVARQIGRTIPVIHGGEPLGAAAALRWKTQINENAKSPAFMAVQPDLCHNELVGWGQHGDATRQLMTLVTLRHSGEHVQTRRRFDFTVDALREVYSDVVEVVAQGEGALAEFFDLAFLGDVVSLHLAFSEGIDPGPSPVVDSLKAQLSPQAN